MQLKIEYKELPKNILFIYTEIFNAKYGIINNALNDKEKLLLEQVCHYNYKNNADNAIVCREHNYPKKEVDAFFEYLYHTKKSLFNSFFDKTKIQTLRDEQLA